MEGYIYFILIQMNLPKLGLSQGFPPELMDESRCTNRGNSYSAKSKNSSKTGSLAISNVSPNVTKRASENMPVTSERPRQRHTYQASQNYQESTVQKVPVYREIEVPQSGCFSSNRMKMERENGLLDFFCKKRACSNYEPRERPPLLVDFSK